MSDPNLAVAELYRVCSSQIGEALELLAHSDVDSRIQVFGNRLRVYLDVIGVVPDKEILNEVAFSQSKEWDDVRAVARELLRTLRGSADSSSDQIVHAPSESAEAFKLLNSRRVDSVSFTMDYLQIQFDGAFMNVYAACSITRRGNSFAFHEHGFADAIRGAVMQFVEGVHFHEDDSLVIQFSADTRLEVDLGCRNHHTVEALTLHFPELAHGFYVFECPG